MERREGRRRYQLLITRIVGAYIFLCIYLCIVTMSSLFLPLLFIYKLLKINLTVLLLAGKCFSRAMTEVGSTKRTSDGRNVSSAVCVHSGGE